jgi:hypothetical protein
VLAARGLPAEGRRGAWIAQAALATRARRRAALRSRRARADRAAEVAGFFGPALAVLVLGGWLAVIFARNARGLAVRVGGDRVGRLSAAPSRFGWPRTQEARMCRELADAGPRRARERGAPIVGYRDYLNGLSWELKTPIPVVEYLGELEPQFEPRKEVRDCRHLAVGEILEEVEGRRARRRARADEGPGRG